MEGVRILNEISPISVGIWVAIGLFIALGILELFVSITTLDKKERVIMILISLMSFVFAIIIFLAKYNSPMKYEAIIDDNVKISEFEEKYKIIEKRGDIYVIEEIESNDD